jgi:putative transposase
MPSRNVLKLDMPDSYYHVYARGSSHQPIFLEDADFQFFLTLFRRYLSHQEFRNSAGIPYDKLYESIELVAYCMMGNHFHLLLFQRKAGGMQRLMRGVMATYSRYCNTKYGRSGQLFESRYKASRVSSQSYLEHVSRYIHLNPRDWRFYPYSSIHAYLDDTVTEDWLHTERVMAHFDSTTDYRIFVADREAAHKELENLKHQLADSGE